jgi:hypothetical protein
MNIYRKNALSVANGSEDCPAIVVLRGDNLFRRPHLEIRAIMPAPTAATLTLDQLTSLTKRRTRSAISTTPLTEPHKSARRCGAASRHRRCRGPPVSPPPPSRAPASGATTPLHSQTASLSSPLCSTQSMHREVRGLSSAVLELASSSLSSPHAPSRTPLSPASIAPTAQSRAHLSPSEAVCLLRGATAEQRVAASHAVRDSTPPERLQLLRLLLQTDLLRLRELVASHYTAASPTDRAQCVALLLRRCDPARDLRRRVFTGATLPITAALTGSVRALDAYRTHLTQLCGMLPTCLAHWAPLLFDYALRSLQSASRCTLEFELAFEGLDLAPGVVPPRANSARETEPEPEPETASAAATPGADAPEIATDTGSNETGPASVSTLLWMKAAARRATLASRLYLLTVQQCVGEDLQQKSSSQLSLVDSFVSMVEYSWELSGSARQRGALRELTWEGSDRVRTRASLNHHRKEVSRMCARWIGEWVFRAQFLYRAASHHREGVRALGRAASRLLGRRRISPAVVQRAAVHYCEAHPGWAANPLRLTPDECFFFEFRCPEARLCALRRASPAPMLDRLRARFAELVDVVCREAPRLCLANARLCQVRFELASVADELAHAFDQQHAHLGRLDSEALVRLTRTHSELGECEQHRRVANERSALAPPPRWVERQPASQHTGARERRTVEEQHTSVARCKQKCAENANTVEQSAHPYRRTLERVWGLLGVREPLRLVRLRGLAGSRELVRLLLAIRDTERVFVESARLAALDHLAPDGALSAVHRATREAAAQQYIASPQLVRGWLMHSCWAPVFWERLAPQAMRLCWDTMEPDRLLSLLAYRCMAPLRRVAKEIRREREEVRAWASDDRFLRELDRQTAAVASLPVEELLRLASRVGITHLPAALQPPGGVDRHALLGETMHRSASEARPVSSAQLRAILRRPERFVVHHRIAMQLLERSYQLSYTEREDLLMLRSAVLVGSRQCVHCSP